MDIAQWLENTADRAPPGTLERPTRPKPFRQQVARPESAEITRKYHRKRQRASSDSSVITHRPYEPYHMVTAQRAQSPDYLHRAEGAVCRSQNSNTLGQVSLADRGPPQNLYERRARHKTRQDRYEPKARRRKKGEGPRKQDSGAKRRRSHRRGDGARTTGLVEGFKLKNGAKHNRLTLKPQANVGLFKHGRASAKVSGRGAGLPDLVFSEMKFLQKPREHQDELPERGDQDDHRRKDRKSRFDDGDISAYFKNQPPAPRDFQNTSRRKRTRSPSPPALRSHQLAQFARERHVRSNEPPVELPARPFLGFGSKGAQADDTPAAPVPTSYFTWSKTQHSCQQHQAEQPGSLEKNSAPAYQPVNVTERRLVSAGEDDALERHRKTGARAQSPQAARPTIEAYRPDVACTPPVQQQLRSQTRTASQPLPLPSSPPVKAPFQPRAYPGNARVPRTSYHTSDILDVWKAASPEDSATPLPGEQSAPAHPMSDEANRDPKSSTPTGKLLAQAQKALAAPHHNPVRRLRTRDAASGRLDDTSDCNTRPIERGVHHQWSQEKVAQPLQVLRERQLPTQTALPGNSAPEPSMGLAIDALRAEWNFQAPLLVEGQQQAVEADAEEMLDDQRDSRIETAVTGPIYATAQDAENLARRDLRSQHFGLFESNTEGMGAGRWLARSPTDCLVPMTPSLRNLSIGSRTHSERLPSMSVASSRDVEVWDGFWKPNKLY